MEQPNPLKNPAMDPEILEDESRRKRVKISSDNDATPSTDLPTPALPSADTSAIATPVEATTGAQTPAQASSDDAQASKELEVGITEFVSADTPGFAGIVKKRYGLSAGALKGRRAKAGVCGQVHRLPCQ